ncbi:MAG: alkaline phosphatase, partial [Clostridia bacterium]|nr:alkaline phosphatase [Clostridia bacterium]
MKTRRILSVLLALILALSAFGVAAQAENRPKTFKNVIMMIGDGMGENHLELAKEQGYELFMDENYDVRGQSRTRSFSHEVTDSAAGATALSCGVRNINGSLSVYPFDPLGLFLVPRIITENAINHGMKTGIVTSDSTTGATPAGYSVHVVARDKSAQITKQQLASKIDLIWGAKTDTADRAAAEAAGWTYLETKADMDALEPGSRSFGQFSGDTWRTEMPDGDESPKLVEMTKKAIELLDNDKGFFLMVEGAHIDKNSHRTEDGVSHFDAKVADAANAVKGFDDAIKAAVEFAREDGETLVVVTADHETGNLYKENGVYTYHSGSHSGANVPLIVFGCSDFVPAGEAIDNKEVPVRIAEKLGWDGGELPATDFGCVLKKILPLLNLLSEKID